jgi:hypothetical protein
LLSALLLQVFYGIRSERQLMEQLDYNLLYRWFVGLSPDDPVWDPTSFTKNRGHGIPEDVIRRRYVRAFANLPRAMQIAHESIVYENSERKAVKLITISDGSIIQNALDEARKTHCEIAEAVASALQIPTDIVFRTDKYT